MANRKHAPSSAPHQAGVSPMAQRESAANQGAPMRGGSHSNASLTGHSMDDVCIDTIRTLSMAAVQKAESGEAVLAAARRQLARV